MSDDVEYIEASDERICDCGTRLSGGSWCPTCRQSIWQVRR